jgi:tetratricopeptide (TPR) repeat protein
MRTAAALSSEISQAKTEAVLKLYKAGLDADAIASYLSWEVSQVRSVVMSNKVTLVAELAKLQEEAQILRCAYSKRLAYEPVRGLDGRLYEQRVLKEWVKDKRPWPNSSTPIRAPYTEVDMETKRQVKRFSLKALEVVQHCIRRDAHREAAAAFAAECLGVLDAGPNSAEFLGVLSACTPAEQEAILRTFAESRVDLLRKLRLILTPLRNQGGLTQLLDDLLEEAHMTRKKAKSEGSISCWSILELLLLMTLVPRYIHLELNQNSKADDCIRRLALPVEPTDLELSKLYECMADFHFDNQLYEPAQTNYQLAISKTLDTQSLSRLESRLGQIQEISNCRAQAKDYRAQDEVELAGLFDQAASQLSQVKSSKPSQLATVYNDIGLLYYNQGYNKRAEEYYQKCVRIWEEVVPASHPGLAQIYNSFGLLYGVRGDYSQAEMYFQKGLRIWEEVLPAKHPDLLQIYTNLAALYRVKGDHSLAMEFYQKARAG